MEDNKIKELEEKVIKLEKMITDLKEIVNHHNYEIQELRGGLNE